MQMVYNFEVAEHHNYFVSHDGYLVHNACKIDGNSSSYTDPHSREPKSLKDQYVLEMAQNNQGVKTKMQKLDDPRFQGMDKMSISHKSLDGQRSEVHYVRDPQTGKLYDFKYKSHITEK